MQKFKFKAVRKDQFKSGSGKLMVWWELSGNNLEKIQELTGNENYKIKNGVVSYSTQLDFCSDVPVITIAVLYHAKDGKWKIALDKSVTEQLMGFVKMGGAIGEAAIKMIFRNGGLDVNALPVHEEPTHEQEPSHEEDEPID